MCHLKRKHCIDSTFTVAVTATSTVRMRSWHRAVRKLTNATRPAAIFHLKSVITLCSQRKCHGRLWVFNYYQGLTDAKQTKKQMTASAVDFAGEHP